jgi:hypothetical protein
MEQFLARIQEIDAALEAAHEAEIERIQAARATEPLAAADRQRQGWGQAA